MKKATLFILSLLPVVFVWGWFQMKSDSLEVVKPQTLALNRAIINLDSQNEIQTLISEGAQLNYQNPEGKTPLMLSIKHDNATAINLLLKHRQNLNLQDSRGQTSLHLAAEKGQLSWVQQLVSQGAKVPVKNQKGMSPMFLALIHNHFDIADFLHKQGESVDQQDQFGYTPLMGALMTDNQYLVRYMLKHQPDLKRVDFEHEKTYLMYAAQSRQIQWVKYFLEQGLDVNATTKLGVTPLMAACGTFPVNSFGDRNPIPVVQTLLQAGAQINHQSKRGFSAFLHAARNQDLSLAKYLHQHGADPTLTNQKGQNALILSSPFATAQTANYYINVGVDPFQKDQFKKSAVDYATDKNRQDLLAIYNRSRN